MAELSVTYERKFSDGNYGSEGLSLSWTWDEDDVNFDEHDAAGEALTAAAEYLRTQVLALLARSAAERVRWAANHELNAHDPEERWRQAEESAEVELAAGLRDNARQDDDGPSIEDLPF